MRNISVTGRLGSDPELRYTQKGTAVTSVNIAVNRERKDNDGNYPTDWWRLRLWGKNAENFANLTHKGSRVGITGRPEINTWQDKNGNERQTPQIQVDNFDLLDSKNPNQAPQDSKQTNQPQSEPFEQDGKQLYLTDNDLPF